MNNRTKLILFLFPLITMFVIGIIGIISFQKGLEPDVTGSDSYTGFLNTISDRPDFSYTQPYTSVEKDGLRVSAKLGSNTMSSNDGKAYMILVLEGEELQKHVIHKRPSLNLGIVIDRSGSMSGEKLSYVKQALNSIASMLLPQDKVTLITYDGEVSTIYNSEEFNKESFLSKVRSIESGGSTYLEGGLKEGIEQVNERLDEESINKVILLSDGLANIGLSDPDSLASIVSERTEGNIIVSTVGIGTDYDDVIMSSIAIAGNGNYYFLEDPAYAEDIFVNELQNSITTVAKNVSVKFNMGNDFKVTQGIGYNLEDTDGFSPNDIYAGRTSTYLFEIEGKNVKTINIEQLLASLEISFDSVQTAKSENLTLPLYTSFVNIGAEPLSDDEVYYEYINGQLGDKLWSIYEDLDGNMNELAKDETSDLIELLNIANKRIDGVFDNEIASLEEKEKYLDTLGDVYINESSIGRDFQKSNQSVAFDRVYNK